MQSGLTKKSILGEKPKNLVIHRDGFNNEDGKWYEHYFKAQGISYSIVEVRKNIGAKITRAKVNLFEVFIMYISIDFSARKVN